MLQLEKNNYSLSKASIALIIFFCAVFLNHFKNWGTLHHPFVMDIDQYYSYLHAVFIEHDLSFSRNAHLYWLIETPTHQFVPKVTYGMSMLYAPFFLIAHLFSGAGSTGYEPIYAWSVHIGCILYPIVGLWYCRKNLLLWFNEKTTAIAVLLLFFGTNLFYYTLSESEAVHGALFFLISVFLYHVIQWDLSGSKKHFLWFMFLGGFIVLIRPTECLVLIIPLLIGVTSLAAFKTKIKSILSLKGYLILGIVLFLIPLVPQLLFWKAQSGRYLFFSYGSSERFYWADPQLSNFLFSFRKGWLVYTPLMLFGIIGFASMYAQNKKLFYPVLVYFLLNVYAACCWWDWAYGGSFGMRAMVHVYAVLVIPFAYAIQWILDLYQRGAFKKIMAYGLSFVTVLFCLLNVYQANLYKHHIIHWDSMTKNAYEFVFFKRSYSEADKIHLESLLKHPDYDAMRHGKRDE